jgi:hypothetical protein
MPRCFIVIGLVLAVVASPGWLHAQGAGSRAVTPVHHDQHTRLGTPRCPGSAVREADWPGTQHVIPTLGVEEFGPPLFVPIAGKRDEDF